MGKALVYAAGTGAGSGLQLAGQTMAANMMDADAQEGAQAFAQKRKPHWQG
jgi:1,4-dihydroxy-2-naphthoyl-CoA synthase